MWHLRVKNLFSGISVVSDKEFFEELAYKDNIRIERIVSYGHTTKDGEWYDQESDEFVVLLKGEAVLSFENSDDVRLCAGDSINILAHQKHRVAWTKPHEETIWLAIHY